jgi:hypothetical protein
VIDMQDELRGQALKLFSGFPYSPGAEPGAAQDKPKAKPRSGARKGHAKK